MRTELRPPGDTDVLVLAERPRRPVAMRFQPWQPEFTEHGLTLEPPIDIYARDPYWRRIVRLGEEGNQR